MNECNPDWAPSLHLGHTEVKSGQRRTMMWLMLTLTLQLSYSKTVTEEPAVPAVDSLHGSYQQTGRNLLINERELRKRTCV